MAEWFWELLFILRTIVVMTLVIAAAIAFGVLVAIKMGHGLPVVAIAAAVGFLLFIVLPLYLWLATRASK